MKGVFMFASHVIAPFAVCAVVAAATVSPVISPGFSTTATLTSAFRLASVDNVDRVLDPSSHSWDVSADSPSEGRDDLSDPATNLGDVVSGGSFGLGLVDILSIMSALAANNPRLAATMQTVTTTLLTELAQGKPLGEAMVDVSLQLVGSVDGDLGTTIQAAVAQVGRIWALAPAVISGAITVAVAIPQAVAPVVTAVATAVTKVIAAVGSDALTAAVATGLNDVVTAAAKGIVTMVGVVQEVLHDIGAVLNGGSGSAAAARGSTKVGVPADSNSTQTTKSNAPQAKKNAHSATSARAAAGARPKRSTSVPADAKKSSARGTAGPARASGKRDAHAVSGKAGAKSAR